MSENGASDTPAGERAVSPTLVAVLADMVEAALRRGSKAASGVASTQDQLVPSKESVP